MTKIMVVDDEPAIGKLLLYQLQGYGYQVVCVPDGLTALQRLEREQPDLILLDVMLPSVSGWDICRQIRATSSVPIIMLTSKSADADIVTGLGAGADDYVAKPFKMMQLQARIEAVLRRANEGKRWHRNAAPAARQAITVPRSDPVSTSQNGTVKQEPEERTSSALPITPPAGSSTPPLAPIAGDPSPHLGQRMREARLARGLSLNQVERDCKIRWEFLQAIEQENFSYVPRHQLRQALRTYAEYLGLDLRALVGRPPAPPRDPITLHYAAIVMVVVLLLAVGIYLLQAG